MPTRRALILLATGLAGAALPLVVGVSPASADTFTVTVSTEAELRAAVDDANASPGTDTITFAPATNGVAITLSSSTDEDENLDGDFDVTESLVVQGNGSGVTVIDGNDVDRLFQVTDAAASLTLRDLTLTDGSANGDG